MMTNANPAAPPSQTEGQFRPSADFHTQRHPLLPCQTRGTLQKRVRKPSGEIPPSTWKNPNPCQRHPAAELRRPAPYPQHSPTGTTLPLFKSMSISNPAPRRQPGLGQQRDLYRPHNATPHTTTVLAPVSHLAQPGKNPALQKINPRPYTPRLIYLQ